MKNLIKTILVVVSLLPTGLVLAALFDESITNCEMACYAMLIPICFLIVCVFILFNNICELNTKIENILKNKNA